MRTIHTLAVAVLASTLVGCGYFKKDEKPDWNSTPVGTPTKVTESYTRVEPVTPPDATARSRQVVQVDLLDVDGDGKADQFVAEVAGRKVQGASAQEWVDRVVTEVQAEQKKAGGAPTTARIGNGKLATDFPPVNTLLTEKLVAAGIEVRLVHKD